MCTGGNIQEYDRGVATLPLAAILYWGLQGVGHFAYQNFKWVITLHSQGYLQIKDSIDYWTGFWQKIAIPPGIAWRNHKRVWAPDSLATVQPRSVVLCVHPTPGHALQPRPPGTPTVTLTLVNTFNHSDVTTVIEQEIPSSEAKFVAPVEIQFSYVKGKYVYASGYH